MPFISMNNMDGEKMYVELPDEIADRIAKGEGHYILMEDLEGHFIPVEVSPEVYELSEAERLAWEREK